MTNLQSTINLLCISLIGFFQDISFNDCYFGTYDEKLIELKIEHNVNQIDFDRIRAFQKKLKSPWASNLPLPIFTKLVIESVYPPSGYIVRISVIRGYGYPSVLLSDA